MAAVFPFLGSERVPCPSCGRHVVEEVLSRHREGPLCRTRSWLDRQLAPDWYVIDGAGGVQEGWPRDHRRDLRSPFVADPERARRIALRSPVPGVAAPTAIRAVRHYYAHVGRHHPRIRIATSEALAYPAAELRQMAALHGVGDPFWTTLPFDKLAASYASAGFDRGEAKAWYSAAVAPVEARQWLEAGVSVFEVAVWRRVTPYPRYAREWRAQGFGSDEAAEWVAARVLRASDAALWRRAGLRAEEVGHWCRLPARTALWWREHGATPAEAEQWLCSIGHTDAESRRAYLAARQQPRGHARSAE
jgi:hypothetical protein